jgi:hypothetical protein
VFNGCGVISWQMTPYPNGKFGIPLAYTLSHGVPKSVFLSHLPLWTYLLENQKQLMPTCQLAILGKLLFSQKTSHVQKVQGE